MGYFPNMTAWEFWAASNCFKCAHWPEDDDDGIGCPVEAAHMLYGYDLCNAKDDPGKVILDMLIPIKKDGVSNERCAMFRDRHNLTDRHLRDWAKYKALMAERDAAIAKAKAKAEAQ